MTETTNDDTLDSVEKEVEERLEADVSVAKANPAAKEAMEALDAECARLAKSWSPTTRALDIAAFGRFMASPNRESNNFNVDAATSVAHAISTNVFVPTHDFFSRVDDLAECQAVHLGHNELGSGCMYEYYSVDLNLLERHLGAAMMNRHVWALLDGFLNAAPSGRRTTMPSNTPTFFAAAVIHETPINLVYAFEKPVTVRGTELSLSELSIMRLDRGWAKVLEDYSGDERFASRVRPMRGAVNATLADADPKVLCPTLSQYLVKGRAAFCEVLTKGLDKGLDPLAPGAGAITGRFLDVWVLKIVPPSCLNRDDLNMHKRVVFGDALRARFSSQSLKRSVRKTLQTYHTDLMQGVQTKRVVRELMQRLGVPLTNRPARHVVKTFVNATGAAVEGMSDPLNDKSNGDTNSAFFYGLDNIASMEAILREGWNNLQQLATTAWEKLAEESAKEAEAAKASKPKAEKPKAEKPKAKKP